MAIDLSVTRLAKPGTALRPRNLGLALAVIAVAQLMVVLDVAIVNVALPSIQRSLHFTAANLEWVVNAYAIAFGGLLLLGGRAGDLFGRRRLFIAGTLLFTIGSLAGGLATTSTFLIIARVAQGIGGAIVAPTALSLLADTFAEGTPRNRALGVYSAVSAGGGALGLLLGGVITNYFSWRWILFVNVPVGILLALVAPRVLVASKGRPGRLDLPGAASVTAGATLLVYSLSRAAIHGWSDSLTVATMGVALGLLVAFVAIEAFSRQPLMPLRIFANRNRSGAYALSLGIGAILSGMLFLLTLFLQNVLGFSPLQAGFAFLPTAAGVVVGAGITSRLIGRIGPRPPMTTGPLLVALGLFWLSGISVHASYASHVLGPLLTLAVGLGMVFVSTSVVAISGITPGESGLASALLNVGRQLGGSLGIAILGTVAATVARNQLVNGPLTHAAVNHAVTAGYATAFEIAARHRIRRLPGRSRYGPSPSTSHHPPSGGGRRLRSPLDRKRCVPRSMSISRHLARRIVRARVQPVETGRNPGFKPQPRGGATKMRFMIVMKANKDSEAGVLPSEKILTEMGKYNEELVKAGVLLAAEGLHASSKGARVRFSGGKATVIDGPFAETKELIAGFWLWQVKSKEEAIEWLKRGPWATGGGESASLEKRLGPLEIEIRQVFEPDDFGTALTPELKEREERLRAQSAAKA